MSLIGQRDSGEVADPGNPGFSPTPISLLLSSYFTETLSRFRDSLNLGFPG